MFFLNSNNSNKFQTKNFLKLGNCKLLILLSSSLFFMACTKEIDSHIKASTPTVIVDGYIESGQPPIILLTRSTNLFGDLNINDLGQFFLHGASMTVSSGNDTTHLVEYCLKDLPVDDSTKTLLLSALGVNAYDSSAVPNVCVYTVPDIFNFYLNGTSAFLGQFNHTYNLNISYNGKKISSSTYLPDAIPRDSLTWKIKPNSDSLVTVYSTVSVPPTNGNFIRYWTKRNKEQYYTPISGSVFDDKLFGGKKITLPIERGQSTTAKMDGNTYSYFWKGDTVHVKWANIDSRTFDFFYTLENDGTGNPFSNPIKVKTNIDGAFGIWAGYGVNIQKLTIPK